MQTYPSFKVSFTETLLPKTVHHCNHLKNYRSVQKHLYHLCIAAYLDVDFSKNLTIV